jgi:hypothetical protein
LERTGLPPQLALAPACEVERCRAESGVRAHHLTHARLGEEEAGRDLITLCDGCHRRAQKLGRELGRVPRRDELVGLDPRRPLYEPADIAALTGYSAGSRLPLSLQIRRGARRLRLPGLRVRDGAGWPAG